jgi:hypothetical protein
MKRLSNTIIYLACFLSSQAAPGPGPKAVIVAFHNDSLANTGAIRFQFKNLISGMKQRDSILIIFDRYDHTGAGVVHQVFSADSDESIMVSAVAPGKYYVTVQCVGLHRDRLEKIVTIRSQRSETVRIKLTPSEAFFKENVIIPAFHPDLSDLAVTRFR